jgi:hypothetical protein
VDEMRSQVIALLSRFTKEKLARVSPLVYERLYSLPEEARDRRELIILAAAVHYAWLKDARSVTYLERLFFNWQAHGVPRWALKRLAEADTLVDRKLLKELGYHGESDEPLDFSADEYYRFYRRPAVGGQEGRDRGKSSQA